VAGAAEEKSSIGKVIVSNLVNLTIAAGITIERRGIEQPDHHANVRS
jgi:hypothetical protein